MEIKAVKFRKDGFYSQPFAFGGEEGGEKFDKNIRYRGSLQNYLIDTGNEVILVDTGLPAGFPDGVPEETAPIYIGKCICDYMDALAALGYKPEQVTKILLTHKHADHSGELRSFPNAKIYVNAEEIGADELKDIPNIVPVEFNDGAYYNFPESQKIVDGVYFIKAKGHTNGNSLIIAENDGLFYMFEGDITYVDEALYANKLSVVFDDLPAARETMDRVREFVRRQPTVYCGTHTPQGYENLEAKRIIPCRQSLPRWISQARKPAVSMFAPSAAMSMILLNMTVWHSRTCLMTGVVRAVSNLRQSLIKHKLPKLLKRNNNFFHIMLGDLLTIGQVSFCTSICFANVVQKLS